MERDSDVFKIGAMFQEILDSVGTDPQECETRLKACFDLYKTRVGTDNPFFPMLQGLSGTIDEGRVWRSFNNAFSFYRQTFNSEELGPVRLYKLDAVGKASRSLKEKLFNFLDKVKLVKTTEAFREKLKQLSSSDDRELQMIAKFLLKKFTEEYTQATYALTSPDARNKRLDQAFKDILSTLKGDVIEQAVFKTDRNKQHLESLGFVYKPGQDHSWGSNLGWILGHVRKGRPFVVCSNILENRYRTGVAYQGKNIPCAFARELCLVLKAGYVLRKTEDGITLEAGPSTPERLERCDTTGFLGEGINPSDAEIEAVYQKLADVNWDTQKDFKCHFEFQSGQVNLVVLDQDEALLGQADRLQALTRTLSEFGEGFDSNTRRTVSLTPEFDAANTSTIPLPQSDQSDVQPVKINTNIPKA